MSGKGPSLLEELLADDFGHFSEVWLDQTLLSHWLDLLEPVPTAVDSPLFAVPIQDELSRESAAGSDTLQPAVIYEADPAESKSDVMDLPIPLPMMNAHEALVDEPLREEVKDEPQQSSAEKSTALDVSVFFAENNTIPVKQFTPTVETAPLVFSAKSGIKEDENQAKNCEEKSEPPKEAQPIATAFKESKRRKDKSLDRDPIDLKLVPTSLSRGCKLSAQEKISKIFKPRQ